MSWGITVKDVDLLRVHKIDIPHKIEELEEGVEVATRKLIALAVSSGEAVEGYDTWADYVCDTVPIVVEEITDAAKDLSVLYCASDDMDSVEDF